MPAMLSHKMPDYTPSDEWGDDTQVQWGDRGLVIRTKKEGDEEEKGGSYCTAFFEAFPKTGAGFIRGEGPTIAEAEENALLQRRKELACTRHVWCRRGYVNGVAICSRCGIRHTNALPAIVELGAFRDPASAWKVKSLLSDNYVELRLFGLTRGSDLSPDRKTRLRLRRLGIRVPDEGMPPKEDAEACHQAAIDWARSLDDEGVQRLREPGVLEDMAFLGARAMDELIELVEEVQRGAEPAPDAHPFL